MKLSLALPLLFAASTTQAAADEISFTAIPDQSLEKLTERANAVSAYLEDYIQESCGGIGVNFTYNAVENYDDAVSALIDDVADIGWYGGLTGVQAGLRSSPAVYLAQRIEDTQFTSVFIQGKGMDLTNGINDAEGRSIAFGSASSTSGNLMPSYYLKEAGVTPASSIYTGSHDATVDAVINGESEIGALNSLTWQRRIEANTTGGSTVFYTTPEFVDYLWVAGAGIVDKWTSMVASLEEGCEDINALLTQAFLAADGSTNPLAKALFNAYSATGYVSITPNEYDPIEETGCELDLIEEEYCNEPIPEDLGNVGDGEVEICAGPDEGTACPMIYEPVNCGGKCTYSNQCVANAAGWSDEECCPDVPQDTICTKEYLPLACGEKACVYDNVCLAESVGQSAETCEELPGIPVPLPFDGDNSTSTKIDPIDDSSDTIPSEEGGEDDTSSGNTQKYYIRTHIGTLFFALFATTFF